MLRCARLPAIVWALAAAFPAALAFAPLLGSSPAAAQGQVHRNFPQKALRGGIAFGTPPAIALNGQVARLAPGARIHGMDNLLVMSGALVNTKYVVDYTLESTGMVVEVWLLTPAEIAVSPWPATPQQAAAWVFDPIAQTWTPR